MVVSGITALASLMNILHTFRLLVRQRERERERERGDEAPEIFVRVVPFEL